MRIDFGKSITWRLTFLFAILSTTVFVSAGTLASYSVEKHFVNEDIDEISGKLELIHHALRNVRNTGDLDALPQRLEDALVGHHALLVSVFTSDGKQVYATSHSLFPDFLLVANPKRYKPGKLKLSKWEMNGNTFRGLSTQMITADDHDKSLNIAIALNIEHHQTFISQFNRSLWLLLSLGLLITALLGWLAARKGLSPIRNFDRIAAQVSASQLNERMPVDQLPSELKELGVSFNDMLQRIEDSFRRLTDFSSDIAHELRTPVSNLMTQSHVALSQSRSLEEYQEILYSNLEEYERLSRMISDMLFLAKAENGLIVPHRERLDLAQEVDAVIEFYEPLADEKHISIVRNGSAFLLGDKLMIRRAISNLLSNAIRHTSESGKITLELLVLPTNQVRLWVKNLGNPIPPEYISRIFDRYYRVDQSRPRDTEGVGLGLAITKSIIEAHCGKITASYENNLVIFEVIFEPR